MVKRSVSQSNKIDFATMSCPTDIDSKLSSIEIKLGSLKNPYVGNKRKMFPAIAKKIIDSNIEYDTVLDLFSGGCFVSLGFKELGKKVYCNDIMKWCHAVGLAHVQNDKYRMDDNTWQSLCRPENKDIIHISSNNEDYASRFNEEEALIIDQYRANALDYAGEDHDLFCYLMTIMICYVLDRCFVGGRLNKGQVLAETTHRVKHVRNNGEVMRFSNVFIPDFRQNDSGCKAFNMDAIACLETNKELFEDVDLVYVDPPYGGQQSDYPKMFKWCEEYFTGNKIETMDYLADTEKYVDKNGYDEEFDKLLGALENFENLVFSYNESSWAEIGKIEEIIKSHKEEVVAEKIKYKYRHRDQNDNIGSEYIIIARG